MAASPLERSAPEDNQADTTADGGNELDELLGRKLQGLDLLAVFLYGIEVAQCPVVVALGVDASGSKHPLGVWEGGTSDRTVCRALVANLVERGLERDIRRLFVTDGGVAIRAAVRAVFGRGSLIQHCHIRTRREILSHLPRSAHSRTGRMLDAAWSETDFQRAKSRLRAVARDLQAADLGGARSVLESLDEGLTVTRLGLPRSLRATFSSTAEAEWAMSSASLDSRQWPAGTKAIEQAATLLRAEERSGPVRGHRDLHWLARALDSERELPLTAEQPIPDSDRAVLARVPASDSLPLLTTSVDVAALLTTAALMVTMDLGVQGVVRELLALAFITLVPGWAVVGRLALEGGIRRVALAVPVSLALCAAGATTMLWLQSWQPPVLFGVLALGSAALIMWTLTRPLRHAIAQSPWPARSLLRGALERRPKERRPPFPRFRWEWLNRRQLAPALTSSRSASAPAPTPEPALAAAMVRSQGGGLEAWLGILAILLSAVSLGAGALAGVLLGASRRRVVIEGALLAGLLVGLAAIGLSSSLSFQKLASTPGAVVVAAKRVWRSLFVTDLLVPSALGLWAVAVHGVRTELVNDYGLLPALPYTFFLSLGLLTVSFVAALARSPSPLRLGVHLVALVVMLHSVEALVFTRPEYVWVYKHIGVVSYIKQHGSVNENLDIYQNWPGFFAAAAWFDYVAGVSNPMQYAAWAPVYFNLLAVLALGLALQAFTTSTRLRWLALFVFVTGNWVGQDYFAPQAFAFVLSLGLLAVLLTWFRSDRPAPRVAALERRLRRVLARGIGYVDAGARALGTEPASRAFLLIAVNAIFAVVVISHQLTPYMVVIGLAWMAAFDAVRPRWLIIGFAVMTVGFFGTRLDFLTREYGNLFIVLNPLQNTHNQSVGWNQGLPGRLFGAQAARSLSIGIWGLALVGAIRRISNGSPTLVPLGLAVAPAGLVLVQDYGGEAIYRVFLFSLPWAAFLAASAIAPEPLWTIWGSLRVGAVLIAMVALFLPSYFGLDEINEVRPTEVAASLYYYDHGARDSVLVLAAPSFPTRASGNYDRSRLIQGADPNLTNLPEFQGRMLTSADLPEIEALVRTVEGRSGTGYLVITAGMKVYCHVYSVLPDGSLDSLDQALAASKNWAVFYRNQDAVIYELITPPGAKSAPPA